MAQATFSLSGPSLEWLTLLAAALLVALVFAVPAWLAAQGRGGAAAPAVWRVYRWTTLAFSLAVLALTTVGSTWLVSTLLRRAPKLHVAELHASLWRGQCELKDVGVGEGASALPIARVRIDIDTWAAMRGEVHLQDLEIEGVRLEARPSRDPRTARGDAAIRELEWSVDRLAIRDVDVPLPGAQAPLQLRHWEVNEIHSGKLVHDLLLHSRVEADLGAGGIRYVAAESPAPSVALDVDGLRVPEALRPEGMAGELAGMPWDATLRGASQTPGVLRLDLEVALGRGAELPWWKRAAVGVATRRLSRTWELDVEKLRTLRWLDELPTILRSVR